MTRLIDADALTDNVDKYIYRITRASKRKLKVGESAILADIKAHIELSPTIDAEPVRHGKWIETDEWDEFSGRLYKCSNCKTFVLGYFDNYCPYCGSRMVSNNAERQD